MPPFSELPEVKSLLDPFGFADGRRRVKSLDDWRCRRALLVTGNPDYEWLADESGYVCSKAAKEVWKAFGVPDRFGFSIVDKHRHCVVPDQQIPEIVAFVEKFLLGKDSVNTNIANSPYNTDLSPWIKWKTPDLTKAE